MGFKPRYQNQTMSNVETGLWEHVSGYRLDADGKYIKYRQMETGHIAHIEAVLNEEEGEMEYRPAIFDVNGNMVEYPDVFYDKERAMERYDELMKKYS